MILIGFQNFSVGRITVDFKTNFIWITGYRLQSGLRFNIIISSNSLDS